MTETHTTEAGSRDRNPVTLVDGVELHIDGEGPRTIVMVHGWPDTWRLWDLQAAYFAPRGWRCVRFTLPGFDRERPLSGHSLDEVVAFIAAVIDAVSPQQPVVLMLHDWGCLFGYQAALRHAHRVAAVVGIDIGDAGSRQHRAGMTLRQAAIGAGYQLWLVAAWRLARAGATGTGDRMTRAMARWMGCRSDPAPMGACMNYPYDMTWTGSHGGLRGRMQRLDAERLPWPLFFAWAAHKPLMFHSGEWVQRLTALPQHRAMAFDCGHWIMRSRAAAFNAAVNDWLGERLA